MTLDVLHVHAGNLYGGVETSLVNLARFAEGSPEVRHRFALCFEGRLSEELRGAGARVDPLGPARISQPWTVLRARRRLRGLLAASKPHAGVWHSAWSQALFAPVLRTAAVLSVDWVHAPPGGGNWLEHRARRHPPAIAIANSRYTAGAVARTYPGAPVHVVHPLVAGDCGAPAAGRDAIRTRLGAAPGTCVITQVSRMERGKGHLVLLRALASLARRNDWACWIVGGAQRREEAAYEDEIKRTSAALGLETRVSFLGQRTDVPQLLSAADVFCQPNTEPEGFGITFVEAMYRGLPVVGGRLGATPEIVDETCGMLVEPGSPDVLAVALGGLLDSPARRQVLGAAGPARARELCEPAAQVQALAAVLRAASRSQGGHS